MKRRQGLRALALMLMLAMTMSFSAFAAADEANADRLNALGLFRGTGSGYALEGTATRLHGIIMLTRMLGEEEEALGFEGPYPFSDVAEGNPSRYTGYAFAKGYTAGVTADTFNPNGPLSFKHYVTFLLRALGYDDGAGDFTFAASLDKAVEIGMMNEASAAMIVRDGLTFYRADLVDLSISALTMDLKDGSATLAEALVKRGVFTRAQGEAQKVLGVGKETYIHPGLRSSAGAQPVPEQPAATSSAITRVTQSYTVASGTVSADVITVDVSDPAVTVKAAMVNNKLGATANFSDIVAASSAAVVVNGNFFEAYNDSKFPIGHVMVDGEFLYGVTGLSSVGFTDDGEVYIGRPAPFFFVEGRGYSWACYELNSRTQGADLSVLYTPAFGQSVTVSCDGVATAVTGGTIQSSQQAAAGSVLTIPQNGYLMFFGTGFASTSYYKDPVVGTKVELEPRLTRKDDNGFELEGVTSILSGAPRLVEKGAICTTLEAGFTEARFTTAVTPRTAVGKKADGKLVIVSTSAASVQQMRELMLQLGCVDAVNLDGGASTALAYNGQIVRNAGRQLTTTLQVFVNG